VVELWEWVLPPGDRHDSDPHASGTRELLHVTEGSITVSAGAETYDLVVGDTVSFYADVEHSYHNPHDAQARFVLCAYEPGVGIAHGSETESA
jgi:quercetin dioxygenase-like cupin family protein